MFTCIVDNSGYFVDIFLTNELPSDIEGGYYLVDGPLPNDIFMDSQNLPRWDGTQWIETGQAPEPIPQEPTELELLMLAVAELDMQRELDRTENQVAIAELAESLIGGI